MDILLLLCILSVGFAGFTDGAGLLPDGPLNATVGGSVIFNITGTPPEGPFVVVTWKFGERQIILSSTVNTTDPGYADRITLFRSTGSLELRNLALSDSGEYRLSIITTTQFEGSTTLNVSEPVDNVKAEANSTDLVELSSVRLSCSSSGSSLSFLWMNGSSEVTASDRVHLTDGGSTLTITNVLRYDQGPYRCEVSNPVNTGTSDPVNLTISYGPENTNVTRSPSQESYYKGSNIILTCSADSRPEPRFNWFLNGVELPDTGLELRLNNVQESGNYSCRTSNEKTQRSQTSEPSAVTVLDAFITSSTKEPIEGKTVNLTCEAVGPVNNRKWMKDGSDLTLADNIIFYEDSRVLSFQPVRKTDRGEYSCSVTFPTITVEDKYIMVVNYGPENVKITGDNEIHVGQTFTLTCSAESEPSATFTWTLNGTEIHNTAVYTKKAESTDSGDYICQAKNKITGKSVSAEHGLTVTDPSNKGPACSGGCIAGIVIACLILVAAALGGGFYFYKKKKGQKTSSTPRAGGQGRNNATGQQNGDLTYADVKITHNKKSGAVQMGSPTDTVYAQVRDNRNAPAGSSPPTYEDHLQRGRRPAPQPNAANVSQLYSQVKK